MGIEVIIQNKKSVFGKPKQLTKDNIMANFPDNVQLGYTQSTFSRWNPLKSEEQDITGTYLSMIDMESYGRGIDVYVAEDMSYIKCTLLVPTVSIEVKLFEEVVKTLAKYMNCKEVEVEGDLVSVKKSILSEENVDFAISRSLKGSIEKETSMMLPCSFYPLFFDECFFDKLKALVKEEKEVEREFDNYLKMMLSENVFYADATFFKNDADAEKELVAIYPIMDGYEIVIPTYDRYPNADSLVSGKLYSSEEEGLGLISYDDFLKEAIKYKVADFDLKHIVINLNEQVMRQIWEDNK